MKTTETTKTIGYCIVAAVSLLVAAAAFWANMPPRVVGFELVGRVFFDGFTDSQQAQSLDVYAVDADARLRQFSVKKIGDVWRIPSHHDYPAEAADRLGKIAATVIGMKREALVGRLATDHARFGVLDPQDENNIDVENIGKRLVLRDAHGQVLADLIIGHKVPDNDATPERRTDPTGQSKARQAYYVRRTDEQQTYRASFALELSTRFSDWIETQLLNVTPSDVVSVSINNYELRERLNPSRQTIEILQIPGDHLELTRSSQTRQWTLKGINADTELLDETRMNQWLRTLTNLKIAGVRPKYQYEGQQFLSPELTPIKIPELVAHPQRYAQAIELLQRNLRDKGFNLVPRSHEMDDFVFVSQFGEFAFSTSQGVAYRIYLGRSIAGDEHVIEFGGTAGESSADDQEATPSAAGNEENADQSNDEQTKDQQTKDDTEAKNRFLMITVHVDEAALGPPPEAPQAPVEPIKPEGYTPEESGDAQQIGDDSARQQGESSAEGENKDRHESASASDRQDETRKDAQDETPPKTERNPAFIEYEKALAEYKQAKTQHEVALMRYEADVKARQDRVEAARKRVAQLNDRFGAWYYVVSADNLASLRLTRADLVKPRAPTSEADAPDLPSRPNIDFPIPDLDQSDHQEGDHKGDGDESGAGGAGAAGDEGEGK